MNFIIELFLLIFLWGNLWCVPAVLAGKRRKKNKQMYILILVSVMVAELIIAVGLLQLSDISGQINIGVYASPALASIVGGFLYWWLAERKDKMTANKALSRDAITRAR